MNSDDLLITVQTPAGEAIRRLQPTESIEFGRDADLVLSADMRLHRRLGRFDFEGGHWWLANIGTLIPIDLMDVATHAASRITPGSRQAVVGAQMTARFTVGETEHVLHLGTTTSNPVRTAPRTDTDDLLSLPLTDDQRLLLLALCENHLRTPTATVRVPSNTVARQRLGWPQAKFNRKLDNLCDRFAAAGVAGVAATPGTKNTQRRQLLVEAAIAHRVVTAADLTHLEAWVALMRERGNL